MSELHEARVAADLSVRNAVRAQLGDPAPHHLDFYAWGDTLDGIIRQLTELSQAMSGQVHDYGRRRLLRDDEGTGPSVRLRAAAALLDELGRALVTANEAARGFQAEIAHISVEVDVDAQRPHPPDYNSEEPPFWPGLASPSPDDPEPT